MKAFFFGCKKRRLVILLALFAVVICVAVCSILIGRRSAAAAVRSEELFLTEDSWRTSDDTSGEEGPENRHVMWQDGDGIADKLFVYNGASVADALARRPKILTVVAENGVANAVTLSCEEGASSAGSYVMVTATAKDGYRFADGSKTQLLIRITERPVVLEWAEDPLYYSGSPQVPSLSCSALAAGESDSVVFFDIKADSYGTDAGMYTARAELCGPGAGNYLAYGEEHPFEIKKARIAVEWRTENSENGPETAENVRVTWRKTDDGAADFVYNGYAGEQIQRYLSLGLSSADFRMGPLDGYADIVADGERTAYTSDGNFYSSDPSDAGTVLYFHAELRAEYRDNYAISENGSFAVHIVRRVVCIQPQDRTTTFGSGELLAAGAVLREGAELKAGDDRGGFWSYEGDSAEFLGSDGRSVGGALKLFLGAARSCEASDVKTDWAKPGVYDIEARFAEGEGTENLRLKNNYEVRAGTGTCTVTYAQIEQIGAEQGVWRREEQCGEGYLAEITGAALRFSGGVGISDAEISYALVSYDGESQADECLYEGGAAVPYLLKSGGTWRIRVTVAAPYHETPQEAWYLDVTLSGGPVRIKLQSSLEFSYGEEPSVDWDNEIAVSDWLKTQISERILAIYGYQEGAKALLAEVTFGIAEAKTSASGNLCAGTYSLTAEWGEREKILLISDRGGTADRMTVVPKSVKLQWTDRDSEYETELSEGQIFVPYGSDPFSVSMQIEVGGILPGDRIENFGHWHSTYDPPEEGFLPVGSYYIWLTESKIEGADAENYALTFSHDFLEIRIVPLEIGGRLKKPDWHETFRYDGTEKRPTVPIVFSDGSIPFTAADYELFYSDNVNAGIAKMTVVARGNFTGEETFEFEIVRRKIEAIISGDPVYNAEPQDAAVMFSDAESRLSEAALLALLTKDGAFYSLAYGGFPGAESHIAAGRYRVEVFLTNSAAKNFEITATTGDFTIEQAEYRVVTEGFGDRNAVYNGNPNPYAPEVHVFGVDGTEIPLVGRPECIYTCAHETVAAEETSHAGIYSAELFFSVPKNANYRAPAMPSATLIVSPRRVIAEIGGEKPYNGKAQSAEVAFFDGESVPQGALARPLEELIGTQYIICYEGRAVPINAGTYSASVALTGDAMRDFLIETRGSFRIEKAENAWVTEYARCGWARVHQEAAAETLPAAQFGSAVLGYYTDEACTREYFGSFDRATPKGTYYVKATVPETENYTGLSERYSFVVTEHGERIDGSKGGEALARTAGWHWEKAGDGFVATAYWICEENCGWTEQERLIAERGVAIPGTCVLPGSVTYSAVSERNGSVSSSYTEILPAYGHCWKISGQNWDLTQKKAAEIGFVCSNSGCTEQRTVRKAAEIEASQEATCTSDGYVRYFAVIGIDLLANGEGDRSADRFQNGEAAWTVYCVESIPATGHDYAAVFDWSFRETGVWVCTSAVLICKNDTNHRLAVDVTTAEETEPATCETEGIERRIAYAECGGKTFSDLREKKIPATGHRYGAPIWNWEPDGDGWTASASFVCETCGHTEILTDVASEKQSEERGEENTVFTAEVVFQGENYREDKIFPTRRSGMGSGAVMISTAVAFLIAFGAVCGARAAARQTARRKKR